MKLKVLWLALLVSIVSFAQNTGSISGKLIEKKSKNPVPYSNISIKKDSKIVTGGISQDNGNFTIKNIPFGDYTVDIESIGFKKITKNISISTNDKSVTLGTIALEESATQLEAVEVVREKTTYEQKIDRKVINVGKDLISAGATAGEILNNIPSVQVDPQTNAISLRGNENVRVLVDGKPTNIDPAQLLKQIPSSSIKSVELITNPSAKYNPEGMSGIINIVLNKNSAKGYNGSINNGVTFGKTPKINSSLDLNYRTGSVNFFGNYGFNHGYQANHGDVVSHQTGFDRYVDFKFRNKNTSHLYKVGLDYYIDNKNTFSIYTSQNFFNSTGESTTAVDYFSNALVSDLLQSSNTKNTRPSTTYNALFRHKFAKDGETLDLEYNFNKNKSTEFSDFATTPFSSLTNYTNDVFNTNDNTKINVDYTNPLKNNAKLETGLETRIETTANNLDRNSAENSNFDYKRYIYSAYATYGKQWQKWGFQVGARFESYEAKANFWSQEIADENGNGTSFEIQNGTFNDKINTIYPSGYLSYKASENNSFNLNYSRRVDRPSIGQVSPIREWSTPTIVSVGKPNLRPQFTNSLELNYTRKLKFGSISTVVFYRITEKEITRVVTIDPNDINRNILSYLNYKNNDSFGAEISGNLDFTKWWSANIGTDIYFKKVRGTISNQYLEKNAQIFNARINNTFKATKNLRFQLFAMYRGNERSLQMDRKYMLRTDVGASYNVLKGKGTISARYSDIFKSMKFRFEGDNPYPQTGAFYWESNTFYVGFNYRFGGGNNRETQRKQRDKNETQGGGGMF